MNEAAPGGPEAPRQPPQLFNLPNALTTLRLLLVPFFALALFTSGGHTTKWRLIAFAIFAVAAITDKYDGDIARKRGLVTNFGKLADPIADKALTGTALVGLSVLGDLPWWVTVLILVREVGVTLLRFWIIRHGVLAASRGGKAKTFAQAVALGLYVLPLSSWLGTLRWWVLAVAVVLTVVSGLDYVIRAIRMRREGLRRQAEAERAEAAGEPRPSSVAAEVETTAEPPTRLKLRGDSAESRSAPQATESTSDENDDAVERPAAGSAAKPAPDSIPKPKSGSRAESAADPLDHPASAER